MVNIGAAAIVGRRSELGPEDWGSYVDACVDIEIMSLWGDEGQEQWYPWSGRLYQSSLIIVTVPMQMSNAYLAASYDAGTPTSENSWLEAEASDQQRCHLQSFSVPPPSSLLSLSPSLTYLTQFPEEDEGKRPAV
jgi:hypothetical protein